LSNKVEESIILAAGYSRRFKFDNETYKKYMLPFERSNLINYIIAGIVKAGISKINIVVDDKVSQTQILNSCETFFKNVVIEPPTLNFVINKYSERENGYSLFLGIQEISSEQFILSMADHIFTANIYLHLINNYNNNDIILATDPMKIEGIYDLDDCTKIYGTNSQIEKIGKKISAYNRLDMGAFIMKTHPIKEISQNIEGRMVKFGVSDIVRSAIDLKLNIGFLDFPDTLWLDIDNHFEYDKLNKIFTNSKKFRPFDLDYIDE